MTTNTLSPSRLNDIMDHNIAILIPGSTQDDMLNTPISIFHGKDIFVGRDVDTCYPFIHSSIVSRVHFRLYSVIYDEDQMANYPPLIYCEDRQSSNGTYVNNTLIGTYDSPRSPYLLNDGDVISIRPHWSFHFHQTKQANGKKFDQLQTTEIQLFKDRYTISRRLLGSGVYGKVFLANDILTQKQVACKIIDLRKEAVEPDLAPVIGIKDFSRQKQGVSEVRKQQIREIEILSKLSHPNIATLYKAFRTPHSLYIFNELATGGDLYSFLQSNGSSLEDLHARIISRQIAVAVEHLHANGVAHRDLKPENILVMRTGIGHRVVLTDFGCAGYIGGNSGRMMSTVGTYDYVAPEVHKPQSKGYTEAIDMWSLGIITLCLLTGQPFVSFEELQDMSQADIAVKLVEAGRDYPQWSAQGKDFINKLIVIEPLERMTAKETVNHDWFRKPERIAAELDKLYERSIIFWTTRSSFIGIVEDLPDVIPDFFTPNRVRPSMGSNSHRNLTHKRLLDSASPYFGLERHLHLQGERTKSDLHSQRKRILKELKDENSQFIDDAAQPGQCVADRAVKLRPVHLHRADNTADTSDNTSPIHRPAELSSTSTVTENPAAQLREYPVPRAGRSTTSNDMEANMDDEHTATPARPESPNTKTHNRATTNRAQSTHPSPETTPSIRHVDARDMFGSVPIEIKAAEAAEAEHTAFDDFQRSGSHDKDEEMEENDEDVDGDSAERPVEQPPPLTQLMTRSYSLSLGDREVYDEAARDLPKLSTAKAFSQAIARRKLLLKGSEEADTGSSERKNDI